MILTADSLPNFRILNYTMGRIIASINMTIDGFCDHTAVTPDEEVHQFFTDLLYEGDTILYGRTTYQLMESYWPLLLKSPSGEKTMDDFARSIDRIPKLVFSRTLGGLNWDSARLAAGSLEDELRALKARPDMTVFLGSPSVIVQATNMGLIDEYRLVVHPVIIGEGLPLMKDVQEKIVLKLVRTKLFGCGAVALFYVPAASGNDNVNSDSVPANR